MGTTSEQRDAAATTTWSAGDKIPPQLAQTASTSGAQEASSAMRASGEPRDTASKRRGLVSSMFSSSASSITKAANKEASEPTAARTSSRSGRRDEPADIPAKAVLPMPSRLPGKTTGAVAEGQTSNSNSSNTTGTRNPTSSCGDPSSQRKEAKQLFGGPSPTRSQGGGSDTASAFLGLWDSWFGNGESGASSKTDSGNFEFSPSAWFGLEGTTTEAGGSAESSTTTTDSNKGRSKHGGFAGNMENSRLHFRDKRREAVGTADFADRVSGSASQSSTAPPAPRRILSNTSTIPSKNSVTGDGRTRLKSRDLENSNSVVRSGGSSPTNDRASKNATSRAGATASTSSQNKDNLKGGRTLSTSSSGQPAGDAALRSSNRGRSSASSSSGTSSGLLEPTSFPTDSRILLADSPVTLDLFYQLVSFLPLSVRFSNWLLAYSPSRHGISLQTFYRQMSDRGSSVLLIKDQFGCWFGAFLSAEWRCSGMYYGSGESFVFTAKKNNFTVYPWSALNNLIMYSDDQMIAVGGGGALTYLLHSVFCCLLSSSDENDINHILLALLAHTRLFFGDNSKSPEQAHILK
ncbi:unnamed protein product [Amoebophrya sp. A25]|nr:unnamed protein product [Amoebophrya sp. A25]|eukprot:GSA25T00020179001.1